MSDLPGNDYVAVAKFRIEGVHEWQGSEGLTDATAIAAALDAQTQATLALAYEARTANLIATLRVGAVDMTDWPRQIIDNFHRTSLEIAARMGIEGAIK